MKRSNKRRNNPLVLVVVLILVAVVGVEIVQVYQKLSYARQEEAALIEQVEEQKQANEALRADLAKAGDEEFIKGLARDLLGLAEEGERIFYDVND